MTRDLEMQLLGYVERIAVALEKVQPPTIIMGKDIIPDTSPREVPRTYPFPPKAVEEMVTYLKQCVKEGKVPCHECRGMGKHTPNCPYGPNRVGR